MALRSDAEDIQGGTTREGIHMGVMAGTVDLMQRAYPGTEIRDGVLHFQPRLPASVEQVEFWMQFQRTPLLVSLERDRLVLTVHRREPAVRSESPWAIRCASSVRGKLRPSSCPRRLPPADMRKERDRSHGAV